MTVSKSTANANGNGKWHKIAVVLLTALLTLILGVMSYSTTVTNATSKELANIQASVAGIHASRFDAADGLAVWQEIAAIREDIAALPKEFPPPWFIDRVDAIDDKADKIIELDHRLIRVEDKLDLLLKSNGHP